MMKSIIGRTLLFIKTNYTIMGNPEQVYRANLAHINDLRFNNTLLTNAEYVTLRDINHSLYALLETENVNL